MYPPAWVGPRRSVDPFTFAGREVPGRRAGQLLVVGEPPPRARLPRARTRSGPSASRPRRGRSCRRARTSRSAAGRGRASGCASARSRCGRSRRCCSSAGALDVAPRLRAADAPDADDRPARRAAGRRHAARPRAPAHRAPPHRLPRSWSGGIVVRGGASPASGSGSSPGGAGSRAPAGGAPTRRSEDARSRRTELRASPRWPRTTSSEPLRTMPRLRLAAAERKYEGRLDADRRRRTCATSSTGRAGCSACIDGLLAVRRAIGRGGTDVRGGRARPACCARVVEDLDARVDESRRDRARRRAADRRRATARSSSELFQNLAAQRAEVRPATSRRTSRSTPSAARTAGAVVADRGRASRRTSATRSSPCSRAARATSGRRHRLAACAQIADNHGGRIRVEANPDGGSVFASAADHAAVGVAAAERRARPARAAARPRAVGAAAARARRAAYARGARVVAVRVSPAASARRSRRRRGAVASSTSPAWAAWTRAGRGRAS